MPKMTITLYGRDYQLACAAGQEQRVLHLASLVEERMRQVASQAGNTTEPRLFMLTCMMMADELLELSDATNGARAQDEELLVARIAEMQDRVANLVTTAGRA